MKCRKTDSYLHAYADGELTGKRYNRVKDHLAVCESCRKRGEELVSLEGLLKNSIQVPPVPEGLMARTMAEARRRQSRPAFEGASLFPAWNPLLWIAELSVSMRLSVCATVLLALVAGLFLNGGQVMIGPDMSIEPGTNLYGLEWFNPAPPGSLSSIYLAMAEQSYE
jgi:anti-sigma factor RsiW